MSGFHPQICRDVHIKGCVVLGLMANAYFWAVIFHSDGSFRLSSEGSRISCCYYMGCVGMPVQRACDGR
jgi:hypothetical protein